jgi:dihydrofolate reductase
LHIVSDINFRFIQGLTKEKACDDLWLNDIDPVTELGKWFGHVPVFAIIDHNQIGVLKMKTILIFISTLDGKVTKWGDPFVRNWSSKEDQHYFNRVWNDNRLVIIGSKTYNADPIKPSSNHLLVILTRNPKKYRINEIPGQIEFTDETPSRLVKRFEKEGQKQMMVAGGAHIATSFLKENLIDELWLTVEPIIFGIGGNFVINEKLDIHLQLVSCERLNTQGTLITKYAVIKDRKIVVNEY